MADKDSVEDLLLELEKAETGTDLECNPAHLAQALAPLRNSYVLQYHGYVEAGRINKTAGDLNEAERLFGEARRMLRTIALTDERIKELNSSAAKGQSIEDAPAANAA